MTTPEHTVALKVVAGGLMVLMVGWVLLRKKSSPLPLPPGPPPKPLIGNILDMPKDCEWETYARWSEKYGDIMMVNLLGQPLIIISSSTMATDLLDKRSGIYSDRPTLEMSGVLVGYNKTLAMLPYGDTMRRFRRMLAQCVGTRALMKGYTPLMEWVTHDFLLRMLHSPEAPQSNIRRATGATILSITHGYKVQEGHDRFLHLGDAVTDDFSKLTAPGAFLVDVFPMLTYLPSWFPGVSWKRQATKYRETFEASVEEPYAFAKEEMERGRGYSCFVSRNLEAGGLARENESDVKYAAMSLFSGGADTVVSATYAFYMAMTLFPDAQRKAQEEVDNVIGNDRLPCADDWDALPYIRAVCLETLRWLPVGPLGLPHRLMKDDTYNGYFIPEGSFIVVNIWKMLHDPAIYHEPFEFKPERYIVDPVRGYQPEPDPSGAAFGYGRRICPGIQVAHLTLFLQISMAMAVFNITPAKDEKGRDILPEAKQLPGIISHPKPFKCVIRPRSEKATSLIISASEEQI